MGLFVQFYILILGLYLYDPCYSDSIHVRNNSDTILKRLEYIENKEIQKILEDGHQFSNYSNHDYSSYDDSQTGPMQVTSPMEIAFTASLSKTITLGSGQAIVYDTIMMNYGNAYNKHSGHFTAPVSGIYLVSAGIVAEPGKRVAIDLFLNSKFMYVTMYADARSIHPYAYSSKTFPIFLRQGDNLWFQGHLVYEGSSLYRFPNYLHTYFAGVLLNQI